MKPASRRAQRVRQLLHDARLRVLKRALRTGDLRSKLQAAGGESMDAEDMIVRQVELAGRTRRPLWGMKRFVHAGGMLVLRGGMEKQIRRQVAQLRADYTLADAVPVHLDFPADPTRGPGAPAERYIALLLIGPRQRGDGQ